MGLAHWCAVGICALAALTSTATAGAKVLRVGTYHGIRGQFRTIQAAVDAARPGDWILVAPGDYKTTSSRAPHGHADTPAGVLITTPNTRLRGMNRNKVIVDGTKPGSAPCSRKPAAQNLGPNGLGLNGIMVWEADDVWVQNLTSCNFLGGSGHAGNEIWWNGGDGGGQIHGWGFYGSYLSATSTFFASESTAAEYGIFSSDWSGGTWFQTYASNFNDSGYYIGACQRQCDQTVDRAHAQYNALGYSGTNSGGQLIVKNSEFDHNQDGFDTNSQNNDGWPSPQDGSCQGNGISPITHTHSCWVFMHNYVHDNNNPNVPGLGAAAAGPVGTGMSISGGRNDTIMDNRFVHNGAWGVIFVPYPDTETPPADAPACKGGISGPDNLCDYDNWGNALTGNTFTGNGFFGNDTNGDFAETTTTPAASNCFRDNTDTAGHLTSSPDGLQQSKPTCGGTVPPDPNPPFTAPVLCDSQFLGSGQTPCLPNMHYPRHGPGQPMPALPHDLRTMPNPCKGVPRNPWCPRKPK